MKFEQNLPRTVYWVIVLKSNVAKDYAVRVAIYIETILYIDYLKRLNIECEKQQIQMNKEKAI